MAGEIGQLEFTVTPIVDAGAFQNAVESAADRVKTPDMKLGGFEFGKDTERTLITAKTRIAELFDTKFGGKAGAASKAMDAFQSKVAELSPMLGPLGGQVSSLAGSLAGLPLPAAAAAAAVAGLGLIAVKGFQQWNSLVQTVQEFSERTNITVEDSSRLIAAFDDIGISAGKAQATMFVFNRSLSSGKLEKFGVDIAKNSNGLTDQVGTLINVSRKWQTLTDATEKTRLAQAAFGRQAGQVSRLLDKGPEGIQSLLAGAGAVGQVVTEKDVANMQRYREAVDTIQDVIGAFTLKVGASLAPAMTKLAETFAELATVALPAVTAGAKVLGETFAFLVGTVTNVTNMIMGIGKEIRALVTGDMQALRSGAVQVFDAVKVQVQGLIDVIDRLLGPLVNFDDDIKALRPSTHEAEQAIKAFNDETSAMDRAVTDASASLQGLIGDQVGLRDATRAAAAALDAERDAAKAANRAALEAQLGPAEDRLGDRKRAESDRRALRDANRNVDDAYKARSTAAKGIVEAENNVNAALRAQTDASRGAFMARQALSDLEEGLPRVKEGVVRAEWAINDALRAQKRLHEDKSRSLNALKDAEYDQQRTIRQSQKTIAEAQKVLNGYRLTAEETAQAILAIRDAELELQGGGLDVRDAQARLSAAQQAAKVNNAGDLGTRQAAVDRAALAVRQALANQTNAADKLNALRKAGSPVASEDEKQSARDQIEDANRAIRDTGIALIDAKRGVEDYDTAVRDSAASVSDAMNGRADAVKAVRDAEQSIVDQKQAVVDADVAVTDSATAVKDARDAVTEAVNNSKRANENYMDSITDLSLLEETQHLEKVRRNTETIAGFDKQTERQDAYTAAVKRFTKAQEDAFVAVQTAKLRGSAQFLGADDEERKRLLGAVGAGVSVEEQALRDRIAQLETKRSAAAAAASSNYVVPKPGERGSAGNGLGVVPLVPKPNRLFGPGDGPAAAQALDKQLEAARADLAKIVASKPVGLQFDDQEVGSNFLKTMEAITKQPVSVPINFQVVDTTGKAVSPEEFQRATSALFGKTSSVAGRFDGGDVNRGRPYVVGEQRRGGLGELFIPGADGKVVSNAQILAALREAGADNRRTTQVTINTRATERASWLAEVGTYTAF